MNPPMFTMPWAVPRVALGLNVLAKSNPTIEPGPPAEITTTRTTSSHRGARPGSARMTVHMTALLAMIVSTIHDRRCGYRPVRMPMKMPAQIAETTEIVNSKPAVCADWPWATVR
jgi:hypothetical protein